MLDRAVAIVLTLITRNLGTVPEDDLVVRVHRDQQILELVVLQVPDRLLLMVRICPDRDTVVLALLRASILVDIGDLGNIPHSDAALNTGSEQEVLARGVSVGVKDTCRA